jgi:hypothetical protein
MRKKNTQELVLSNSNSISFSNSSSSSGSSQSLDLYALEIALKQKKSGGKSKKSNVYTEIMVQRWKSQNESIPHQDKLDIMSAKLHQRVQFSPEYSQEVF